MCMCLLVYVCGCVCRKKEMCYSMTVKLMKESFSAVTAMLQTKPKQPLKKKKTLINLTVGIFFN